MNEPIPDTEPISAEDLWLCRQNLPHQLESPILITQGEMAAFGLRLIGRLDSYRDRIIELRAERDQLQKELDDERDQGSCNCGYFGMTAREKIRDGDFHAEGCSYLIRSISTVPFGEVI